jgi:hypothetical protein
MNEELNPILSRYRDSSPNETNIDYEDIQPQYAASFFKQVIAVIVWKLA